MRSVILTAALSVAMILPTCADDAADLAAAKTAIETAKLSPKSDLAMWCGAAMMLVSQATKDSDAAKSKAAEDNAGAFFGEASPSLAADGVKQDDFPALTNAYMTVASAQLVAQSEAPSHNVDDCVVPAAN